MLWGGRRGNGNFVAASNRWSAAMPQPNDLSRSLVALDQNSTIIAVVELSQSSWLVGGMLPGIERQPCKKLEPSPEQLLAVLHRRAKTDRLDTELLKRGFLGGLRGERGHCTMARIPTIAEEDAKRPNRERECLVRERTRIVNRMKGTLARLGIRNFKPTLRKAAERVTTLHTPQASPLPPNASPKFPRNMARLGFVVSHIKEIHAARPKQLDQSTKPTP